MPVVRIIFLVVGLFLSLQSQSQTHYYVATDGSDTNVGSIESPFKTIQTAIQKVSSGDFIHIREGIYREKIETATDNLKLLAFPGEYPILKGSDLISGWTVEGNYWKKTVAVQPQQVFVDGNHPLQQIGWPWPSSVPLSAEKKYRNQVGEDLDDMAAGRFYYVDGSLYIWLEDGSDPNSHQVEVSQRSEVLILRNAKNIYVKGIQVEHSNANTYREQGAAVYLGKNCVMDSCLVQWCDFSGIALGDESQVINSEASHNGAVGIQSSGMDNFLVSNTRMAYNNYRNFFSQWHAGGFKGAAHTYGTIENCELDHNNGCAIWFDYCFKSGKEDDEDGENLYPIIIRNNYIHSNGTGTYDYDGIRNNGSILIEVTEQAYVYNNIIDDYEARAIHVSSSWKSFFVNNVISNGKSGSYYAIDGGASYLAWAWVKENVIANNILYNNKSDYDIRMMPDDGGTKFYDNICQNNLIYRAGGSIRMRHGGATLNSLEAWQNTDFGDNSISTDPLFSDAQFHLSDNSPCINAGYNVLNEVIKEDYEGSQRLIGPQVDMGIYESIVGGSEEANALLNDLTVSLGSLVPGFESGTFVYHDTLPDNTVETPTITVVTAVSDASVAFLNATNVQSTDEAERTSSVIVTSANGLYSNVYEVVFYSKNTTGNINVDNHTITIYPNPVHNTLNIAGLTKQITKVKVLNMNGQVMLNKEITTFNNDASIDIRCLSNGIYIFNVINGEKSDNFKVIVSR